MPAVARSRRSQAQRTRPARFTAPMGGINTVAPLADLPPGDAPYLYNMIPAENGLRARLGYVEWCTGLTGAADNTTRTTMPFSGGRKNGATDKLFAVTSTGIWDVTPSTPTPVQLVVFGIQNGDAGYGIYTVSTTPAGRYLLYCDEENGLYVYAEQTATWTKVPSGTTQLWAASTAYAVGNRVVNGGNVYVVTVAGISAAGAGPAGVGAGIVDGTVTWNYVSAATVGAIGPSLSDQNNGFTADPANFAFVTVWGSRVWFVEKDSSRSYYLSVNAIFGTATSFDFGSKMRSGGPLVGLYGWSYDGGSGMDTLLVGISTAGDVVIYKGTDPTSAATFGIKGTWSVGGVVAGRRIATDIGGDILVLSLLGARKLSELVMGPPGADGDRDQYATAKIANLFNLLASTYRTLPGWGIYLHPTDNALIITVPSAAGQATTQLAMSFATKGWSLYRNLPMLSAGVWNGTLFFGTPDGRVCANAGYVDGVQLADPNAFTPVAFSALTSFQNGGEPREKRIHLIRTIILSQTPNPTYQVTAKFDFDLVEPANVVGSGTNQSGTWDNAVWDAAIWGGDLTPSTALSGAAGMGRDVAIAIRGLATSRTTLVGFDVYFEPGGLL